MVKKKNNGFSSHKHKNLPTLINRLLLFSIIDQNCIKQIHEKVFHLYNRIKRAHGNVENVLESIIIWGKVPLYQRKECSTNSLLDIDDRTVQCKNRTSEVNNSTKLIEYMMEENYRLLFDLPLLERKKEFGKNRFRKTIIRQFGKHQGKDKIQRTPTVVSNHIFLQFYNIKL